MRLFFSESGAKPLILNNYWAHFGGAVTPLTRQLPFLQTLKGYRRLVRWRLTEIKRSPKDFSDWAHLLGSYEGLWFCSASWASPQRRYIEAGLMQYVWILISPVNWILNKCSISCRNIWWLMSAQHRSSFKIQGVKFQLERLTRNSVFYLVYQ